jgi:hypothetical protein
MGGSDRESARSDMPSIYTRLMSNAKNMVCTYLPLLCAMAHRTDTTPDTRGYTANNVSRHKVYMERDHFSCSCHDTIMHGMKED